MCPPRIYHSLVCILRPCSRSGGSTPRGERAAVAPRLETLSDHWGNARERSEHACGPRLLAGDGALIDAQHDGWKADV
eukprot:5393271-Pleurochrysis_carterae.AAC.2